MRELGPNKVGFHATTYVIMIMVDRLRDQPRIFNKQHRRHPTWSLLQLLGECKYLGHISGQGNTFRCLGKGAKKKGKKLTIVSFMYVCVAGNGEMLDFFSFFPPTIV